MPNRSPNAFSPEEIRRAIARLNLDSTDYEARLVAVEAWPAAAITSVQISHWDTAYGWGDHASGGYLKADGTVALTGNMAVDANITIDGRDISADGTALDALVVITGKVKIDVGATAGFLGAANNDGVLRTSTGISYADGGNFITLTTNDGEIDHGSLAGTGDDDHTSYHTDARAATWLGANHETTYNHGNYNTAYGWGNHAGLYDAAGTAAAYVGAHESTYNHGNFGTAYGWGDHAGVYDTTGTAAAAVGSHESTYNHGNYNTAYGWGDHASGGYLKADGSVGLSSDWTTGAHSIIGSDHWYMRADSKLLYFGAANDASITYNGTNLIIKSYEVGTGSTYFPGSSTSGSVSIGSGIATGVRLYVDWLLWSTGRNWTCVDTTLIFGRWLGSTNHPYWLYGLFFRVQVNEHYDGNVTGMQGVTGLVEHRGGGTVTTATGVVCETFIGALSAGGDITTAYALSIGVGNYGSAGGVIVNAYGIRILDINDGTTLNYAIYTNDGIVYHKDNVGINVEAPDEKLQVAGNIHLDDNYEMIFGTGKDASIYFDGAKLVIDAGNYYTYFPNVAVRVGPTITGDWALLSSYLVSTDSSQNLLAFSNELLYGASGSGNTAFSLGAATFRSRTDAVYDGDAFRVIGMYCTAAHQGTGTVDELFGAKFQTYIYDGGGDVTRMCSLWLQGTNDSGGSGAITYQYGLYVDSISSGTYSFAIFTNAGQVRIGGDLFFAGAGSGLPRASIYAYNMTDTITISGTGIANKVQITTFDTNDVSNLATPDHTNDHITILKAGDYLVLVSISISSTGGSAYKMDFGVFKNDGTVQFQGLNSHRNLSGGGGDDGSVSISDVVSFSANDTVEVWCWNETNTNNVVIDDITLTVVQVGG